MYQRETKQETRLRNEAKILRAAERVFAEAGYKGASISRIAAEAEVPKSNISYYFQSKERLYRRVLEDIVTVWLNASNDMDELDDPAAALQSYIHAKMDLARDRPFGSKVWANEIIHGAAFIQDFLEGELRDWMSRRIALLNRWIADGRMRRTDPTALIYMIWATTQHYADFQHQIAALNENRPLSEEDWGVMKDSVTSTILEGVGLQS